MASRLLFPMLIWILKMHFTSCAGVKVPRLFFPDTVFVGITGEDLHVHYQLTIPVNQSKDFLTCFDPDNQVILKEEFSATRGHALITNAELHLKMLMTSGEYHCQYKVAKAYFFLRLRDHGYTDLDMVDYTNFIVLASFSGVLLVFSVFSSVYVFRGSWKKQIPKCGNSRNNRKQNNERTQAEEPKDDSIGAIASSTALYASLEPRPRSIYDVLDRSAVNTESQQRKPPPNPKTSQKPGEQSAQAQEEGVFESVYENF
ncbi:NFAT activation molecule 1 [Syngnathus typhle]